jgi:hypothetical protein
MRQRLTDNHTEILRVARQDEEVSPFVCLAQSNASQRPGELEVALESSLTNQEFHFASVTGFIRTDDPHPPPARAHL